MILIWRPWKVSWTGRTIFTSVLFGLALAGMNLVFYESIARIPLGVAVSVEFVGPVAVAVFRGRGWAPRIAALIAFGGVALIGGLGLDLSDPRVLEGFLFGLGAGAAWALYILLGSHISQSAPSGPSLAVGTAAASIVFLPFLWGPVVSEPLAVGSVFTWTLMLSLIGVALFSSTIPYSIESVAFSRLSAPTFALLTALLPATSTLVGAVALQQIPSLAELIGLVLISIAVWLASRPSQAV